MAEPDGGAGLSFDYLCPPGDAPLAVDGGWFVTERQKDRVTCLLAATEAHRDLALKSADEAEATHLNQIGLVAAVAVVIGIGLGFITGKLSK